MKGKLAEGNCTTEPTASYSKIVKIIFELIIMIIYYPTNWNFYSLTTFLNMTMLPAHQGVHGVAPGGVLYTPTIPAHRADTINSNRMGYGRYSTFSSYTCSNCRNSLSRRKLGEGRIRGCIVPSTPTCSLVGGVLHLGEDGRRGEVRVGE